MSAHSRVSDKTAAKVLTATTTILANRKKKPTTKEKLVSLLGTLGFGKHTVLAALDSHGDFLVKSRKGVKVVYNLPGEAPSAIKISASAAKHIANVKQYRLQTKAVESTLEKVKSEKDTHIENLKRELAYYKSVVEGLSAPVEAVSKVIDTVAGKKLQIVVPYDESIFGDEILTSSKLRFNLCG